MANVAVKVAFHRCKDVVRKGKKNILPILRKRPGIFSSAE